MTALAFAAVGVLGAFIVVYSALVAGRREDERHGLLEEQADR